MCNEAELIVTNVLLEYRKTTIVNIQVKCLIICSNKHPACVLVLLGERGVSLSQTEILHTSLDYM